MLKSAMPARLEFYNEDMIKLGARCRNIPKTLKWDAFKKMDLPSFEPVPMA